jgi:hypothetical protein
MIMNSKVYDILKWVVMIVLPAIATAYAGLSALWGFPYVEQITGTIAVIELFAGTLLGVSTYAYNKQEAETTTDERG